MMRPASHRGEEQATRHPSYFSLCPSNPGSDSPRGTLDRSPPIFPLRFYTEGTASALLF